MKRRLLLVAIALLVGVADARAQGEAVLGLGLSVSTFDPTGTLGLSGSDIGPLIRLRLGTGLGPTVGFDWHTTGVEAMAGGQRVYVGKLRIRPVMGGAAYTWRRGPYWVSGSLTAGYAFVSLDVNDRSRPPFRTALNSEYLSFDATGGFVWRPQIGVWYDAGTRVGITANIAYVGVRPMMSIATERGTFKTRLDGASTVVSFGLVYGVF